MKKVPAKFVEMEIEVTKNLDASEGEVSCGIKIVSRYKSELYCEL